MLVDIYVRLYRHANTLPVDEEELADRIEDEIYRMAEKRLGVEPDRPVFDGDYQKLKEETAATLWMKIEEKAEINQEEPEEDKSSFGSYLYSLMKVVLTVFVLILTVAVLFRGWQKFYGSGAKEEIPAVKMETATASTEDQITIEDGGLNPGWEQKPDGKLYYTKLDGRLADGPVALGKQILTFSRNGELTMIGDNKAVSENRNLFFDEMIQYEIKGGDIYKEEPRRRKPHCSERTRGAGRFQMRISLVYQSISDT